MQREALLFVQALLRANDGGRWTSATGTYFCGVHGLVAVHWGYAPDCSVVGLRWVGTVLGFPW
ncbi:hypothetical protein BDV29DRAFT_31389 [Aspergillus leporis]|uniref:Uncharacterized protein n=1 Tax=Aspergillus leporis TaxID=41062 RepID=A0A5N5WPY4_9EURO|nr:hypothetical protein BDV29DRAFT_31389 [Aspergillus leporis]